MFNFPTTSPFIYTFNDMARKSEDFLFRSVDFQKDVNNLTLAFIDSITDGHFTTYTKKAKTFNENVAEDAKKFIETGTKSVSKNSK